MAVTKKLEALMRTAIRKFNADESYLIENDLSERCICARFAMYLEAELKLANLDGYYVDVEYNRGSKRRIDQPKKVCDHNIVVDLIVHRRGYDPQHGFSNLICVEMKKESRKKGLEADKDRLCKLTDACYGFCYRAGFMIMIHQDKRREEYGLRIDSIFENGMER